MISVSASAAALPFAHERMREQRTQVLAGRADRLHVVGLEAERDRRIEGVGERELAEQRRPAPCRSGGASRSRSRDARDVALRAPSDHGRTSTRSRMHIAISLRSARKPECISDAIERAHARARGSSGHMPGCRSARYSPIASESQTTGHRRSSCRQARAPSARTSLVDAGLLVRLQRHDLHRETARRTASHAQPAAQRPRRVVLVADVEGVGHQVRS